MVDEQPIEPRKTSFWSEIFRKSSPEDDYWTRNTKYTLLIGVPVMLIVMIIILIIFFS